MIPRKDLQPIMELQEKRKQEMRPFWRNVKHRPGRKQRSSLVTTGLFLKRVRFNMNLSKKLKLNHMEKEPLEETVRRNQTTKRLESVKPRRDLEII